MTRTRCRKERKTCRQTDRQKKRKEEGGEIPICHRQQGTSTQKPPGEYENKRINNSESIEKSKLLSLDLSFFFFHFSVIASVTKDEDDKRQLPIGSTESTFNPHFQQLTYVFSLKVNNQYGSVNCYPHFGHLNWDLIDRHQSIDVLVQPEDYREFDLINVGNGRF